MGFTSHSSLLTPEAMDLDAQIQSLIDNAPQDGVTPRIVAAIAPVLKLLAQKLRHSQYHILQSLDNQWVLTTLSDRANPNVEKRVIYAWAKLQDIPVNSALGLGADAVAIPIPITHILFQLTALETVDSIIFFEKPGDSTNGIEVRREDVQNLIQLQLKQNPPTPSFSPSQLPPDIA